MRDSSSGAARVLALFKKAGFSGFATTDPEKVNAKLKEWGQLGILCNYKGEPRKVHPEVCKWHREQVDEPCNGCPMLTTKVLSVPRAGYSVTPPTPKSPPPPSYGDRDSTGAREYHL
jgi:hypothetical protein